MEQKNIEERISILEDRISELQQQVEALQNAVGIEKTVSVEKTTSIEESVAVENPVVADEPMAVEKPVVTPSVDDADIEENEEESVSGIEGKLGKKVMSILASVLVFCSLILFGNLIQPYLTPEIKTALMFVVSIAFAVVGIWKMGDGTNRYSTLFTAFAGCGVGAVYISSLVSRFVLGTFNDITLLCVIAAWIAVVLVLVKIKSGIFTYICYAGILIATGLAVLNWHTNIIGIVVYIAAIGALFALNFSSELKKVWWLTLQYPVVCYAMLYAYKDNITYIYILYALIFIPLVAQILYYKVKAHEEIFTVVNVLLYGGVLLAIKLYLFVYYEESATVYASDFVFALSGVVILALLYKYIHTESNIVFILPFLVLAYVLSQFSYCEFYTQYIRYAAFFVPILILGCLSMNSVIRYAGYAFLFIYINAYPTALGFYVSMAVYAVALVCMILWVSKNYKAADKYILTALLFFFLWMLSVNGDWDFCYYFVMFGAVSLCINLPWYRRNLLTGEEESTSCKIGYISNELLVFWGILSINDPLGCFMPLACGGPETTQPSFTVSVAILALMTLALACFNIKSLYATYGEEHEKELSIYTSVKLSLFALVVLERLHSASYVISLVGIVLAIAFICVGFYYRLKGFRLYGLVLCLICVAKLLLVDVTYNSSVMRPVGYLAAGILCYFISWIYSKLEKKL